MRKSLRVGVVEAPPYTVVGPDGRRTGIAVELMELAASRLGIRLEWVEAPGPDEALIKGKVDVWPIVAISESRRKKFFITERWLETFYCLLSTRGRPLMNAQATVGRRVAHVDAPRTTPLAAEVLPAAIRVKTATREAAVQAVCQGQADAAFVETRILEVMLNDRPPGCREMQFQAAVLEGAEFGSGVGARRGAEREAVAIRHQLLELARDGTMSRIFADWNRTGSVELRAVMARIELEENARLLRRAALGLFAATIAMLMLVWRLRAAKLAADAANRAKGQFLANVSHEVRTPLNGVIGFANILLSSPLSPPQREAAETIASSSESLLAVVNDILDFSKIEADKLALERVPFDLADLVRSVTTHFQPQAAAKGVGLGFNLAVPDPCWVTGDPTRLRQVLLNLISNAVKFTGAGRVSVTLRATGPNYYSCQVEDTGIGMAPDQVSRLFQAFTQADSSMTRRFGGTGLGLAISRRLTVLMGGDLQVRSKSGSGTCFTVLLPLPRAEAPSANSSSSSLLAAEKALREADEEAAELRDLAGIQVLVVEDNRVNRHVVTHLLQRLGCAVVDASNGAEALSLWEREGCQLILMDCQMPVLDGYEATRQIRERERERGASQNPVPVIALTAHAMRGDREVCLASGMDDYLTKPIGAAELRRVLSHWVRRRGIVPKQQPRQLTAGD